MSSFKQFPFGTAVVLSCTLGWAAELPAPVESPSFIEPGEVSAMSLSMVDQKLALSLAVETHVQIEMVKYALSEIDDLALRQLADKKLRLYEQLFAALNEVTEGRAGRLLTDAAVSESDRDATSPDAALSNHAVAQAASAVHNAAREVRRGGVKAAMQNAMNAAILRVRLQVASEYADLLRAEFDEQSDSDFDRNYSAVDVVNQMQVVAVLRVFERQASDDFGALIGRAVAAAEGHLNEARILSLRMESERNDQSQPALSTAAK